MSEEKTEFTNADLGRGYSRPREERLTPGQQIRERERKRREALAKEAARRKAAQDRKLQQQLESE